MMKKILKWFLKKFILRWSTEPPKIFDYEDIETFDEDYSIEVDLQNDDTTIKAKCRNPVEIRKNDILILSLNGKVCTYVVKNSEKITPVDYNIVAIKRIVRYSGVY